MRHRYTSIPSLLNLPPIYLPILLLEVDTEPLFEFPETYSKFPLAIYLTFGNISFRVALSIYLTLSSPLPVSTTLFSVSVSPLLTLTSTGDTQTQFCLSLCGVSGSWCTRGLFEPSECLWWEWGLILNTNLPLLPSCWGFFFALGCRVSPHGCSLNATQPPCSSYCK